MANESFLLSISLLLPRENSFVVTGPTNSFWGGKGRAQLSHTDCAWRRRRHGFVGGMDMLAWQASIVIRKTGYIIKIKKTRSPLSIYVASLIESACSVRSLLHTIVEFIYMWLWSLCIWYTWYITGARKRSVGRHANAFFVLQHIQTQYCIRGFVNRLISSLPQKIR